MKRFLLVIGMLFMLVAMIAFSFCVFFHFNVLNISASIGDVIGSVMLLPVAIIVHFVTAVISLISLLISAKIGPKEGRGSVILMILLLLIEMAYVGYITLSLLA